MAWHGMAVGQTHAANDFFYVACGIYVCMFVPPGARARTGPPTRLGRFDDTGHDVI